MKWINHNQKPNGSPDLSDLDELAGCLHVATVKTETQKCKPIVTDSRNCFYFFDGKSKRRPFLHCRENFLGHII